MDAKSIQTLEFNKILDRLSGYTAFSASASLVRALRPTNDLQLAQQRQARTSEARRMLSEHPEVNIGGARDVRPLVDLALRSGVLSPQDLLDIKTTLVSSRDLQRFFNKLEFDCPQLQNIVGDMNPPNGLIETISRIITEKGEIADGASPRVSTLRKEVKAANDRIISKLEKLINDSSKSRILQEAIITKRNGRYVVPIKSEYKGRMRCVVQDQSASGATLFVEPLAVVELNNQLNEALLSQKEEERRILKELSEQIGEQAQGIQANVRALAAFDLTLACAKFAEDLRASEPLLIETVKDQDKNEQVLVRFTHARHPLLDPEKVVPIDIAFEEGVRAVVITGPNTGGKTVSLKTLGLLVLMAQSGLHIPAQSGSQTCIFKNVFADIGDEQSIEQSLSTFSGHITNIVRILKKANPRTLVILDELGAGTDPQEGSALARAILAYLLRKKIPSLIATHYPELKAYAHSTKGVINASVEFDPQSLQPTYRLLMGLPGRSNALAIAKRLGIREEIIEDAREMIDPDNLRTEDLLDEIHRQLDGTRREQSQVESLREELEAEKQTLAERLENIENERLEILESAREQSLRELEALRQELDAIKRQGSQTVEKVKNKKAVERKIKDLEENISEPMEKKNFAGQRPRPLRIDDRVFVRNLKTDGTVLEIGEDTIEVMIGKMRVKADLRNIERSKKDNTGEKKGKTLSTTTSTAPKTKVPVQSSPGMDLHLIGMRADDALDRLENYLDEAYAAGMPFARIVHGKGTGILRQLVRKALSGSSLVTRWENAMDNEGGDGVTIAHFDVS